MPSNGPSQLGDRMRRTCGHSLLRMRVGCDRSGASGRTDVAPANARRMPTRIGLRARVPPSSETAESIQADATSSGWCRLVRSDGFAAVGSRAESACRRRDARSAHRVPLRPPKPVQRPTGRDFAQTASGRRGRGAIPYRRVRRRAHTPPPFRRHRRVRPEGSGQQCGDSRSRRVERRDGSGEDAVEVAVGVRAPQSATADTGTEVSSPRIATAIEM